jgi:U3 small nucleolar RNA-associated protein 22
LEGYRWTKGISRVIAGRVGVLARATVKALEDSVTLAQGINVTVSICHFPPDFIVDQQSLFTTPLSDYDILLHLNPSIISTYAQSVSPNQTEWDGKTFRNLVTKEQVNVDYNPVYTFVKDLQELYHETVLVFYDKHGGSVIGLLWNPEKEQPRALKAFLGYSTKPAGGEVSFYALGVLGHADDRPLWFLLIKRLSWAR